jgi:CAAX prenyl protease-like protein
LGQKPEWLPYFGPMLGFAAVLAAADYVEGYGALLLGLRFAVPLSLFLFFYSQGCYPELRGFRPGWAGVLGDFLLGLGVAAVWIAPFMLWPGLRPDTSEAFDAAAAGTDWRPLLLGLRFAGFAVVTPFIEELLVRSYLIRAVDIYPADRDFREIPVGTFAWRSFLVTVAWFTFTHAQWEWPVALAAGVIYNVWLYRRKHIGSLILSHAVTNAALFCFVAWGSADAAPDSYWNLWFFL